MWSMKVVDSKVSLVHFWSAAEKQKGHKIPEYVSSGLEEL